MSNELTQEEANKLFNQVSEAVAKEDSDKLSTLMTQETPEVEEQPDLDTSADEPELDDESDDKSEEDEPEVKEEEDKSAEPKADDKKKDEEDPLAALRAEIAELRKDQHTIKSQTGRMSAIQRRLAAYDKQLEDLKSATSFQSATKVKPKVDEALKDLEETDPALAKTIRTVMEQALTGVDVEANTKEMERIQALRDSDYDEYLQDQRSLVLSKYPNAVEVFSSPHWKQWKAAQPKHIVDLAQSDEAGAVLMALDFYRNDMIAKHPELNKDKEPEKKDEPVNERALQIEEQRKQTQQKAANLENGKSPSRTKDPTDPDALFKKYSEEIRKELTGK